MMLTCENTAWDFKEKPPRVAILPLACLESHGAELPIGTDQYIVTEIAQRVAGKLPFSTFLLPTWPLGTSIEQLGQAGTISLSFETLWAVVRDIVLSLHEHDICSVVVINNHGSLKTSTARPVGNFIVKTAVRQLNNETPGLTAIWVQPFAAGGAALEALFPSVNPDAVVESAILSHLMLTHVSSDDSPGDLAIRGKTALDLVVDATAAYIQRSFEQLEQIKR